MLTIIPQLLKTSKWAMLRLFLQNQHAVDDSISAFDYGNKWRKRQTTWKPRKAKSHAGKSS
jgi:hypothetical protein